MTVMRAHSVKLVRACEGIGDGQCWGPVEYLAEVRRCPGEFALCAEHAAAWRAQGTVDRIRSVRPPDIETDLTPMIQSVSFELPSEVV